MAQAFLPVVGQAFLPVSGSAAEPSGSSGRLGDGRNAIPLPAPTTGKNACPTKKDAVPLLHAEFIRT